MKPEISQEPDLLSPEIRFLAAVGYLPMLFFIPLALRPNHRFCYFHGIQSLVLLIAFVIFWVVVFIIDFLFGKVLGNVILFGWIFRVTAWIVHNFGGTTVSILYLILTIYCFIQAAAGQMWQIPILWRWRQQISTKQV